MAFTLLLGGIRASRRLEMITQEGFDKLLACLDSEPEDAGVRYEEIRQRLMSFFEWRGCSNPEDLTDKTIDQVAKRLDAGVVLRSSKPYVYFHGVALNILKEHWRAPDREMVGLDGLPTSLGPAVDPAELSEQESAHREKERRLDCLDECMNKLPADSLDLVAGYHRGEKGKDKEYRRQMAQSLKIPLNALRIRVYRIRASLEGCINSCIEEAARLK
jgi:DNA-directed RNA polymerase specialized sigma24 family protein